MDKLLIIADDFTGALDTGIQFAGQGIRTRVLTDPDFDFTSLTPDIQVIVVDTETRPLNRDEAYERVFRLVKNAAATGITWFYKKTDSALRGNIGGELQALMDASGCEQVNFIPAYPAAGRTTVDGIQLINGIKVAESVFGQDPFNPVKHSAVKEILREQTDAAVNVYDASTEEDLAEIADSIARDGTGRCCAGCAGFAGYYGRIIAFENRTGRAAEKTEGLLCLCGSVNPITTVQLDHAEEKGFGRENIGNEIKLHPSWLTTEDGSRWLEKIVERIKKDPCYIIDTLDVPGELSAREYAAEHDIPLQQLRALVPETLGRIAEKVINAGIDRTISMTGGDTLMGLMKLLRGAELEPVCEIGQGAVLSRLSWRGRTIQVVSKSGGFGKEDIFCEIAANVCNLRIT